MRTLRNGWGTVLALVLPLALVACGGGAGLPPGDPGGGGPTSTLAYKKYDGNLNPSNVVIVDGDLLMAALRDQPAAHQIQAPWAHQTATGLGVVVAVLDGGFRLAPLAQLDRLVPMEYDALDQDGDAEDAGNGFDDDGDGVADRAVGHGTFVAGMVLLAAPDARILPVRVADDEGRTTVDALIRGLDYAMASGADVINVSLEVRHHKNGQLRTRLSQAKAMGIVVVVSAGNAGAEDLGQLAANPDTITVGAVDGSDVLAEFTNEPGQKREVLNLVAPGVHLMGPLGSPDPTSVGIWSGTSFSAGIVSGAAALSLELDPARLPDDVRVNLEAGTDPVVDANGMPVSFPGRVNLGKVVAQ